MYISCPFCETILNVRLSSKDRKKGDKELLAVCPKCYAGFNVALTCVRPSQKKVS